MSELIHKWELAGVGKAPFKVMGVYELPSISLAEHNPSAYNNQLAMMPKGYRCGSCMVCGTGLKVNYLMNDSLGNKFSVGCDCVGKSGNSSLITKVKALKLQRAKEIRAEKRDIARLERLQQQRDINGGLTDYEVSEKKRARRLEEERIERESRIEILEPIADLMRDGKLGFRDSIADDLDQGVIPYGRGLDITIDVLAKIAGRRNSKAYDAEYDRVATILK